MAAPRGAMTVWTQTLCLRGCARPDRRHRRAPDRTDRRTKNPRSAVISVATPAPASGVGDRADPLTWADARGLIGSIGGRLIELTAERKIRV
ncbi:MAG: hypothetical protein LBG60_16205, partial [Bifidobacteriaceae bacterium]|nr:hypothetical protein [Bifidobacteriaceae bacterium]